MKFNSSHYKDGISNSSSHHHKNKAKHHENNKDNCCKDEALKFAKADKLNPQASYAGVNPIFFSALLS